MNQQEFIQKVFSKCQHQVQTKNPYTGELIMVPCGTRPACRFNKSILSQNKVHAQSLVSRHVYFEPTKRLRKLHCCFTGGFIQAHIAATHGKAVLLAQGGQGYKLGFKAAFAD